MPSNAFADSPLLVCPAAAFATVSSILETGAEDCDHSACSLLDSSSFSTSLQHTSNADSHSHNTALHLNPITRTLSTEQQITTNADAFTVQNGPSATAAIPQMPQNTSDFHNPFDDDDLSDTSSYDDESVIHINDLPQASVGTAHRTETGALVFSSQEDRILHRGDDLSRFSATEHACIIRDVCKPVPKPDKHHGFDLSQSKERDDADLHAADDESYSSDDTDATQSSNEDASTQSSEVDREATAHTSDHDCISDDEAHEDCKSNTDATAATHRQRGRKHNTRFPYSTDYELSNTHEQELTSLQTIPIFGGINAIPPWPSLRIESLPDESHELLAQRAHFAEYMMATVIPLPLGSAQYDGSDVLERFSIILRQLSQSQFLRFYDDKRGSFYYRVPPGYTDKEPTSTPLNCPPNPTERATYGNRIYNLLPNKRDENEDYKAYAFTQKCIARFIGSCACGMRRNPHERRIQKAWRERRSQRWHGGAPDPELALFPPRKRPFAMSSTTEAPDYSDPHSSAVDDNVLGMLINLLQDANENSGSTSAIEHHSVDPFILSMQEALVTLHQAQTPQKLATAWNDEHLAPIPTLGSTNGIDAATIDEVAKKLKSDVKEPTSSPHHLPTDYAPNPSSSSPANDLLDFICRTATKPPTPGQKVVLKDFADYIDAVHNGMTMAPPRIFLAGEGGTGKSFIYEILELLLQTVGWTLCPTALTGVACTSIHTHTNVHTTAMLFTLGIHPWYIETLEHHQHKIFCDRIGNPRLIIVDEISFADAGIVAAVSE